MDEIKSAWLKSKPGLGWNLSVIALVIAPAPWWAWVAVKLWGWFVIPLGAPSIGFAHAFGLSVLMAMFFSSKLNKNDGLTERERDIHRLCNAWLRPLFLLAFGAIAHSLM